ncbi:MAG TPA: chemotaxis response regulator protein-glutamate methylesterase [Atribacteraceae bacterium]|nr:chemotaxis response regulator protein-glutamate methylesterase [Atribacteraceae bacterium]
MKPITVMVVDDSAFMRKVVSDILAQDSDIAVIATARDGIDALEKLQSLEPDVILLDVEMPRMDGLTFLGKVLSRKAHRIIMLSALTGEGSVTTIQALAEGALDFIQKPSGSISLDIENKTGEIISKVKAAAAIPTGRLGSVLASPVPRHPVIPVQDGIEECRKIVFIASSTGGPRALHTLLAGCPPLKHAGMIIVQHMPAGFTLSLSRRLNEVTVITVNEGRQGGCLSVNQAILAPGGKHLLMSPDRRILLNDDPPLKGLRPCADLTLLSLVQVFEDRICCVVLTGMGKDALEGCRVLKQKGGQILAQDEKTSLIFGMPKAVIENGLADRVLALERMPEAIEEWDKA